MGIYVNPGYIAFEQAVNSMIYLFKMDSTFTIPSPLST